MNTMPYPEDSAYSRPYHPLALQIFWSTLSDVSWALESVVLKPHLGLSTQQ